MCIYIYIYSCEPVHNMHEAKWSRAKVAADNRGTGGSTFRAAIPSASNGRTSHLWSRMALFEHAAAPGQVRAVPVEHSAVPGQARAAPVEHSAAPRRARAALFEHAAAPEVEFLTLIPCNCTGTSVSANALPEQAPAKRRDGKPRLT